MSDYTLVDNGTGPIRLVPSPPANPLTRLIRNVRGEKWVKAPAGRWHTVKRVVTMTSDAPRDGDTRYLREYITSVIVYMQAPCGTTVDHDTAIMQNKRPTANVCKACMRLVDKTEGEGAQE